MMTRKYKLLQNKDFYTKSDDLFSKFDLQNKGYVKGCILMYMYKYVCVCMHIYFLLLQMKH